MQAILHSRRLACIHTCRTYTPACVYYCMQIFLGHALANEMWLQKNTSKSTHHRWLASLLVVVPLSSNLLSTPSPRCSHLDRAPSPCNYPRPALAGNIMQPSPPLPSSHTHSVCVVVQGDVKSVQLWRYVASLMFWRARPWVWGKIFLEYWVY